VFERFWNYQKLEWGQASAPVAPTAPEAPPARVAGMPAQPVTAPPMPFTEWPYGGATSLGVNRPSSVDSPFMVAIANTSAGKWMNDAHIQAYGWIDVGANISTSKNAAGNAPAAYDYNPNAFALDQAVLYVERTPDTVQTDHIDWGFRLSGIYGTNYRYTTAYGVASYQLLKHNHMMGYDFPMVWGEIYVPKVFEGLLVRVGRYISVPDVEAQLAPNNYMYSHSITYTFDNYTNTGIATTWLLTKNITWQFNIALGTDTAPWNNGKKLYNYAPTLNIGGTVYTNPLFPRSTFLKDPGNKPSITSCLRYSTNSSYDTVYFCADAINKGQWGYNNLQWYGFTWYHKFDEHWHMSFETYNEHENNVPNANNPIMLAFYNAGGTPFSPQYTPTNGPGIAYCKSIKTYYCTATAQSAMGYLNYTPEPLDNFSLRLEYYDDKQGQRTGTPTIYKDIGIGWQHWLSPQIELRPEFTYYWATKNAFDGNANKGISPDKKYQAVAAGDIIVHF
jgi:Putative beta-barrel porin-2, OmpL-like. bbp2